MSPKSSIGKQITDEKVNKMNELIERLKKDFGSNGAYALMNDKYEYLISNNDDYSFDFLNGMIWGLYSTNYIDEDTRKSLVSELINIER